MCCGFNNLRLGAIGSVRLAGGLVPNHGHLELCEDGVWNRVCGTDWSYRNSFVTCRQLNYPTSELRKTDLKKYVRQF